MKKILLIFFIPFIISLAQISFSKGDNINENFDSIGTSASATLPANWKVDKKSIVRTVGNYTLAGNTTNYNGGANLSSTAGNGIYNFGLGNSGTAGDRTVGGLSSGSGSQSVNIYAFFKYNGSEPITRVDISYDVMRFRNGSNSAGFSIQMFFSKDGINWTSAGTNFLSSFLANTDNNGAAIVPIETKHVLNQTLSGLNINQNDSLFLAWNYSVTSGTTTSNAQALGIDNFVMNNIGGTITTPPVPLATSATDISKTGFTANWNSSVSATNYLLDVSTNSNFLTFISGYNSKDVGNTTSAEVTGLNPATTYYYRVRALNNTGTSGNSNTITAATIAVITYVQFQGISDAVSKSTGTYNLELTITDPDITNATTCSVVFIPDSSTATASYLNNYLPQTVTFPAGSSANQDLVLTISNNGISEFPKKAFLQIQNVSGGIAAREGTLSKFRLTITSGIDNAYYSNITNGLSGENLKTALHNLIKDQIKYPYTNSNPDSIDVWKMLRTTDEDPKNFKNVIGIYSGLSIPKDPQDNWNREHVWSKSHGNFGTITGAGSDAHHLRPENPSVNGLKGNLDFDNGGSIVPNGGGSKYDSDSWEPRDAVKGDVARMIFYMSIRYQGDPDEPNLRIVDYIPSAPHNDSLYAKLSTLLKWNLQDPPDDFEINRNNVIYFYQHNRNPFIDHPEWVTSIWGDPPTGIQKDYVITGYNLNQNFPNPFNPETIISWQLPISAYVTLKIYDILGREVTTLINEFQQAGVHKAKFSPSVNGQIKNLSSGIYFYQIKAGKYLNTKKMILMK
ncbi:MAG: T9SS type A sorting domain-containing protein [Melioribacter sp.]|nr:T9SS type A sorting domain-containing protein [Melioribacter sp.]